MHYLNLPVFATLAIYRLSQCSSIVRECHWLPVSYKLYTTSHLTTRFKHRITHLFCCFFFNYYFCLFVLFLIFDLTNICIGLNYISFFSRDRHHYSLPPRKAVHLSPKFFSPHSPTENLPTIWISRRWTLLGNGNTPTS